MLAVVLAVALAVGAGRPSSPTRAARIAALDAQIKCPACADLSIAQSDAAAAVDLRAEVSALVAAGFSDAAVRARVVAQYGPSVLEVPSGGGAGVLVWALPSGAVVVLAAGVGTVLWRRRRRSGAPEARDGDEALVAAARAAAES